MLFLSLRWDINIFDGVDDELNSYMYGTPICTTLFFFYKNKVYKNIEAENGKILRIC